MMEVPAVCAEWRKLLSEGVWCGPPPPQFIFVSQKDYDEYVDYLTEKNGSAPETVFFKGLRVEVDTSLAPSECELMKWEYA